MAPNEATIQRESFYKSLAKLESLAKSQICTGPNSEVKTWPGGEASDVPGDGPGADKIKEDGTDYNERSVRKSIREKVEKGLPLSVQELALLKSDIETAEKAGPMGGGAAGMGKPPVPGAGAGMGKAQDKKDDDDDDDDDKKDGKGGPPWMNKSFEQAAQQSESIQKGVEVSEFLSEFAKAFGEGLQGIEARMEARIDNMGQQLFGALGQFAGEQGEFNKSLADAVANIGYGVAGNMEQVEQVAQMPAGGPKSQMQVIQGGNNQGFISKSFGGPAGGEQLSKAQVLDVMQDMLEKGQVTPLDVIKFDTTGELRADLGPRILQKARQG